MSAANIDDTPQVDPNVDNPDFPPADRTAAVDRASRSDPRLANASADPAAGASAAPPAATQTPAKSTPRPKTTSAAQSVSSSGSCEASYYDEPQQTANGEMFNPNALTAASKTLPFNTRVRVTNVATGKSVVVRINDRGPYVGGRCLDLSKAAFGSIASLGAGVADVRYEVLVQDAT